MMYLYLAVTFAAGFATGAALVIIVTLVRDPCKHQWHTIETGQLYTNRKEVGTVSIGNYWIDECQTCGKIRTRRAEL